MVYNSLHPLDLALEHSLDLADDCLAHLRGHKGCVVSYLARNIKLTVGARRDLGDELGERRRPLRAGFLWTSAYHTEKDSWRGHLEGTPGGKGRVAAGCVGGSRRRLLRGEGGGGGGRRRRHRGTEKAAVGRNSLSL